MYRDHTIAVVVPAYNEEALIGRVIESMPDFVDKIIMHAAMAYAARVVEHEDVFPLPSRGELVAA